MQRLILSIVLILSTCTAFAQGIRGLVKTATNEPLPYAAIVVKGTSNGTITNAEGRYEIALQPGRYDIIIQYLGYQTQQKSVEVTSGFQTLDVTMVEQTIRLQEVEAKAGNEDPAYTIMRRAIAKSKFHQLQVDNYTARVYGKGSFTILDIPNLVEKAFKKQLKEAELEANFKVGVPILTETLSEISFQQPNQYRRRVIATRNSQTDQVVPVQFFLGSFYSPEINQAVSPLSPKAFGYYKFVYEGTFREQGVDISKIRVIPRTWGEGVFRGVIYIIENTWAIHSLQLEQVTEQGFLINLRTTYTPIQNVWMPVNARIDLKGKFFGVEFTGQAVISQQFKSLKVNPRFVDEVQVVDEKKDKSAPGLSNKQIKGQSFDELVKKQKEFSTKNLRQMMKEYEKQERKERKERKEDVQVVRNDSTVIDSLAGKRGIAFWDSLRSVPLTNAEAKSYVRYDSLRIVREIKAQKDSTKAAKKDTVNGSKKIEISQFLTGATWKVSKRASLTYDSPLMNINYNTVEGYWSEAGLKLKLRAGAIRDSTNPATRRNVMVPSPVWTIGGVGRYGFGWKRGLGYGIIQYNYKKTTIGLTGGRYVSQYNPDNPISNSLNNYATLWFEQNFLKEYQRDFVRLGAETQLLDNRLQLNGSLDYAQRTELSNFREDIKPWFNWKNRAFTPNRPTNSEVSTTAFPVHQALVLNLNASFRLGATRYVIRNGQRIARRNNDAPVLSLNYRKGISGLGGSDVNYDFMQAQVKQSFETGIRSRLSYQLAAGAFLNNRSVYFPDFKHFMGNQFFVQQGDPVSVYRMLPYYEYSTQKRFFEAHVLAEYRKFLLTQLTVLRLTGIKENLFVHYLATPASRQYTEVGYGVDGLIPGVLPFFRVEVISQFQDWKYQGLGFRIGTTLKLGR